MHSYGKKIIRLFQIENTHTHARASAFLLFLSLCILIEFELKIRSLVRNTIIRITMIVRVNTPLFVSILAPLHLVPVAQPRTTHSNNKHSRTRTVCVNLPAQTNTSNWIIYILRFRILLFVSVQIPKTTIKKNCSKDITRPWTVRTDDNTFIVDYTAMQLYCNSHSYWIWQKLWTTN